MAPHLGLQRIMIPSSQVSSLTTGSITLPSAKGSFVATSYESIQTVTLGSTQSTITFSSIPSTYKHLQIRYLARCSRTDYTIATMLIRFNSDSSSNYAGHALYGNGSAAYAYGNGGQTFGYAGAVVGANATANIFAGGVIDILDYANTNKYKTTRSLAGVNINASSGDEVGLQSGLWQSTSAVNRIDFTLETSANFNQYTTFALYGIKG
jgi:hypothetical protein